VDLAVRACGNNQATGEEWTTSEACSDGAAWNGWKGSPPQYAAVSTI
jgi:hypothetical protein